jgi:hypothetical protein
MVRKLQFVLPLTFAWALSAYLGATSADPLDLTPAFALLGAPLVGYGWRWALEGERSSSARR